MLLIVIPSSFAHENDTVMAIDDEIESHVEINNDENVLMGGNDYYFNASSVNDGNGSLNNPYKYLKADRIRENANIYLADGEYKLDTTKKIQQVNFIGSGADRTTLIYDGVAFKVWNTLTLTNLTVKGATIFNYAKLNATNSVFSYGYGRQPDSYGNNFGGAINCLYYSDSYTPIVHIENCTFLENYAEYGGAIYMYGGILNITGTIFDNNHAYNYGGSIACEYGTKVSISKSKFFNSRSLADAGGAIYLKSSSLTINDVEIVNSSATFGGAISSLKTDVSLSYLKISNSTANWDGGAVYHMYGNFSSIYGNFYNNSAKNGGALFIDNSTNLILRDNAFEGNRAVYCAGAIYSLCNNLKSGNSVRQFNKFNDNSANLRNDEYELSSINIDIGNGNYTMYKQKATVVGDLPSYYNLRDQNLVTTVKDQQSSGNCWAFVALAVLESSILKAGGPSLDLSEENMKNIIEIYSDYGWKRETNEGGYDEMQWAYLTSWLGPVLESDDEFDDHSTLSPILDSVMHVQNIVFLKRDDYLDNTAIKEAIMRYGAVETSMLYDGIKYFRGNGYYCWYNNYANHAVTIVGWDDNYSRNNFYGLSQDKGDGAWIVKNSWGNDWEDKGYFYVSYYDVMFAQVGVSNIAYAIVLNDTVKYDRNYQYDIGGKTDYFYTGDKELWYKNVFQADSNEFLAAVSTYFDEKTNWTLSVLVNGNLQLTKQGTSNPGYYTIDLGKFIPLKSGDKFEVVFKVTGSDVAAIPISEYYSLTKETYKPGVSFVSRDGENWEDFYYKTGKYSTHTYISQVACLKAFTFKNIINTTLSLNVRDEFNITAKVTDQYGNVLNNVNVTFSVNGVDYNITTNDGYAVLSNFAFNQFHNTITATFNRMGYNSSSSAATLDVGKINVDLMLAISKIRNNVTLYLESSINFNDNLIVKINGKDNAVNFSKGKGYLNLTNLENDDYTVEVICDKQSSYQFKGINDSFTIDVKHTKIISGDLVSCENSNVLFNVTLVDENNHILPNKELKILLNKMVLNKTTGFDGSVSVPINLENGEYSVDITFEGDSDYFAVTKSNNIKILKNATIDFEVEKYLDNVVLNVILPEDATGKVSVLMDGKNVSEVSVTGKMSISLGDIEFKNYYIEVRYSGDNNYTSAGIAKDIEIEKFMPNITANSVEITEGETATLEVGIDEKASGIILFDAGKKHYFDYISSGRAVFNLDDLAAGNYSVNIIYLGDAKYKKSSITVNVTVKSVVEPVVPEMNISIVGGSVDVSLPSDATGLVEFRLDGRKVGEFEVVDGSVGTVLGDLSCGVHVVEVRYFGDENYTYLSESKDVTVDKFNTAISSSPVEIVEGDVASVVVGVDLNATGIVLVDINGNKFYGNIYKGKAVVNVVGLTAGDYSAKITYLGDENYASANGSVGVKVKEKPLVKLGSFIVVREINADKLIAILKDSEGNGISNAKVKYVLNGTESVVVTESDGKFVIGVQNGELVTIVYEGSDKINSTRTSIKFDVVIPTPVPIESRFNITGGSITLKGYAVDSKAGEKGMTYTNALLDANGNPISGVKIQFAINDKIHSRTTYENGSFAPYELNMGRAGRYTLAYSFGGNYDYASTLAVVCVDLDKKPINIKASAKTFKASDKTKKYTVTLGTIVGSSADGKVHLRSGMQVTLNINGQTYTANTNGNGQASFNIKITKKGIYNAIISYKGDNTYQEANKSVKIIVS